MDLGLKGCRAFVAGASKGLGKACAKSLAGEGALVFICARNEKEIKAAAAEIGAAVYAVADVSRPAEIKRVTAEAITALGGLDILVTNAGGPPTGPFDKAGDSDWDIAYQLTLMSAVRLIREALPALKASGRGRIVNLTGYGVKEPMTDLVVSDSVRAGVTVMAKTIATDLAPFNITVNNIAPGAISTPINKNLLADKPELNSLLANIPLGRLGTPEEVAGVALFLASDAGAYCTGSTVIIDGGLIRNYHEQ